MIRSLTPRPNPLGWLVPAALLWPCVYFLLLPRIINLGALFGIPAGSLQKAISFFLYEITKVLLLLTAVVFVIGVVRTFVSPEKTRTWLQNRHPLTGHVLAALLGVITPFCSCSAVPLFVGFVQGGVPLGVTFSFLIAAPMVNEVALVMLFSSFGSAVAFTYLTAGVLLAVFCGYLIGLMKVERYLEDWVQDLRATPPAAESYQLTLAARVDSGVAAVREIVGRVWPFIILGIAVGAGVHGFVPTGFFATIMGSDRWWSVPLVVGLGVPLYSNAAGIFPVAQALLEKGAALGTTLAFMMSVIGLSLPEAIILRKVLKLPLIALYIGVLTTGIILVGYLFNLLFSGVHL